LILLAAPGVLEFDSSHSPGSVCGAKRRHGGRRLRVAERLGRLVARRRRNQRAGNDHPLDAVLQANPGMNVIESEALQATRARALLAAAEIIVASDLTLVECDRVMLRAAALGELTEAEAADRRAQLTAAASQWHILRVAPEIVERARQPFPGEPIRTLDAIHLASALVARTAIAGLMLLSLNDRVRKAGKKLGLGIIPN
jgi:predicted nucleic acid-binding protein